MRFNKFATASEAKYVEVFDHLYVLQNFDIYQCINTEELSICIRIEKNFFVSLPVYKVTGKIDFIVKLGFKYC